MRWRVKDESRHEHKRKLDWSLLINLVILISLSVPVSADIIPSSRRITWQGNVGVPGGIPNRTTICANLSSGASASQINSAISSCPSDQVVKLGSGTYSISSSIVLKSNVTLRGNGPENTVIQYTGNSGSIITIGNGSRGGRVDITSGYTKGSNTLTLSSASGKDVGDVLLIDQENDGGLVVDGGANGTCTWCGAGGTRSLNQTAIITGKNGNTVTIEPPMIYTFSAGLNPQADEVTGGVSYAGVEDLKIINSPGDTNPSVIMYGAKYSWLKNVESERPYKGSGGGRHGVMRYGFRNEIRDSYFHGNNYYASNSYGWELVWGSSFLLVENNIFRDAKVYMYFAYGGSGSVVGYNYVYDINNYWPTYTGDLQGHGPHSMMSLFEGNFAQKLKFDWVWGSASHHTFFRNWYRLTQPAGSQNLSNDPYVVEIWYDNPYFNLVGNVFGDPSKSWSYEAPGCSGNTIYVIGYNAEGCSSGRDSEVRATLLRHGNYDYATNTTKWCDDSGEPGCQGGDASHTIPDSLYLPGQPSWWCNETPWPPIGPALSPMVSDIPAKRRYEGLPCTTSSTPPPPPPSNLPPSPPTIISVE